VQSRQLPFAERRIMQSRARKRINTARYFNALLHHMLHGGAKPEVPILGYRPAEQRIADVSKHVQALFRELDLVRS